jgi:hypothetical protein
VLGATSLALDAPLPDRVRRALASDDSTRPSATELVARRMVRTSPWTTLEQFTSRQPSVRHLLPPNPARWRDGASGPTPPWSMGESTGRWLRASARILATPGEPGAERRFSAALDALAFPAGHPNRAGRRE